VAQRRDPVDRFRAQIGKQWVQSEDDGKFRLLAHREGATESTKGCSQETAASLDKIIEQRP
jgi:hypothetical protein